MGTNRNNRIFYYDLLRAFAIFCIISCHVFASYVVNTDIFGTKFWYCSLLLNSLRDLGVPLFVILSGALLIGRKEDITTFVKKRVSRVILPYIFWVCLFILCAFVLKQYGFVLFNFSNINDLIFGVISVNPKSTAVFLWFVPMIMVVYAVIFIINKISEYFAPALKISLLLSILAVALINLNILAVSHPYDYVFYSVFAIIGYYLANFEFSRGKISPKILGIIFAVIFVISYAFEVSINASVSMSLNQFVSISQFSWINLVSVISLFLSARYLLQSYSADTRFSRMVFSVSASSYGMYLSHRIVLFALMNFILCYVKSLVPVSIYSALTLILTFVCSWILILTLNRIPHLKKIIGSA